MQLFELCCVVILASAPLCSGESGCPPIERHKGRAKPRVITKKSTHEDVMIYALEQRLSLKCCVRGFPKPNVTWFRDGEPLSLVSLRFTLANDNQELVISRVLTDDSGNYSCMAQNIHGRSKLHNITLDIHEINYGMKPPVVEIEAPQEPVVVGSNITLRCQASSLHTPIMMWWVKMNGTAEPTFLKGDFTTQNERPDTYVLALTITNSSFKDAGDYKCFAKNGVGLSPTAKNISLIIATREEPTNSTEERSPRITKITQTNLAQGIGGGLALVALIMSMMMFIYIKRRKPEGWVTRKLIQMGVVKQAQCHANVHGEEGDDECICVMMWDVFISYNSSDRTWVMNVLHETLQNDYKVCVDYQNFVPGAGVIDNIARCIWRSKTTLFVVSRDFLKSGWSKTEFEITQDKIRRSQGSLIVIMLEDIRWQELPPILRRYTTGRMRVDCTDQQLPPRAWRRLRSLLGPSCIDAGNQVPLEEADPGNSEACLLMMESSV